MLNPYVERAKKAFKVGDTVRIIHLPGIQDTPICKIDSISEKSDLVTITGINSSYWASVSILYIKKCVVM